MKRLKWTQMLLLSGITLTLLQACDTVDRDRNYGGGRGGGPSGGKYVSCGGAHRLSLVDLSMSPDPIKDGQRIARFRVRLRSDGSGECETTISIRETSGNQLVARRTAQRLRPGVNELYVLPEARYRFEREEHCFEVLADIERTHRRVDAQRRFCARRAGRSAWTLN